MPYARRRKQPNRRRRVRNYRRRFARRRAPRIGKPMRPATYAFKRSYSDLVQLNTATPPAGWTTVGNALYRQFEYKLSDLQDYGDFVGMFKQYKLTGVKLEFFFSNTVAGPTASDNDATPPQTFSNSQIIMWMAPSPSGDGVPLGPDNMMSIQSATKRYGINGGRSIKTYAKLKQHSQLSGATNIDTTDMGMVNPRFVSTLEPHTPHYGQNIVIEKVDQSQFANLQTNYQTCRIISTYYIVCRMVA